MIAFRGLLAVGMIVGGIVLLVRLLATGLHPEILTGVIVSCALIMLGLHKLSLIMRARGAA